MWMLDSGPRDYSSCPLNQGPISPVTPILFLSSNLVTLKDTCLGGQGRSAHSSLTNQESSNNCIREPVTNGIPREYCQSTCLLTRKQRAGRLSTPSQQGKSPVGEKQMPMNNTQEGTRDSWLVVSPCCSGDCKLNKPWLT